MQFSEYFRFQQKWLIMLGLWKATPVFENPVWQRLYNVYSYFMHMACFMFNLQLLIEFILSFRIGLLYVLEMFMFLISNFCVVVKLTFVIKSQYTKELLPSILEYERSNFLDRPDEEKRIYKEYANTDRKKGLLLLTTIQIALMISRCILIRNYILKSDFIVIKYWRPFGYTDLPGITLFMDLLYGEIYACNYLVSDLYIYSMMNHVCAELETIRHTFVNCAASKKEAKISNRVQDVSEKLLISAFENYQRLERLVRNMDDLLKHRILIDYIFKSIYFGSIALQTVLSDDSAPKNDSNEVLTQLVSLYYVLILPLAIFTAFLIFWHANEIREKSITLATAIWQTEWYDETASFKKNVLLFMSRAQCPLTLHLGIFGNLTLDPFINIMKGTYTLATALVTLAE